MQMKEFDREFVERTKWIIQNVNCQFEVTLLLNCMLGLVNLPTVRTGKSKNEFQTKCIQKMHDMGVLTDDVENIDHDKTFRAVRNAVSHLHICPTSMGDSIEKIILSDMKGENEPPHTQLEFTVDQLREFALFVADKHLERLGNLQRKTGQTNISNPE